MPHELGTSDEGSSYAKSPVTPMSCLIQWQIQYFSEVGMPTLQRGAPTYDFAKLYQNCIELKEFGPRGSATVTSFDALCYNLGQKLPWTENPLWTDTPLPIDRDPLPMQRHPSLDRDPLPWTETPFPGQRPPFLNRYHPSMDRGPLPWTETPFPRQRPPSLGRDPLP